MNALLATAHPYLVRYGYGALFAVLFAESLGLPSWPGETLLVASSFLASRAQMHVVWVAPAASAAAVVGDNVGYGIDRWSRQRLLCATGHISASLPIGLSAPSDFLLVLVQRS